VTTTDQELLVELADRLRHRFYGKYRGIVTDVDSSTLRIKATVPAVLGDISTGWCQPCVPYAGRNVGFFFLPSAGAGVWIEFEGGDVSYPIWAGCYWRAGELPSDATPTTRGVVTEAPHKLLFDDDADEVTIGDSNGGTIAFDSSGVTATRGSNSVAVTDSAVAVNDDALKVT
jgi:uncharacterized protein involved in type VI secretion and phage assembly